MFDTWYDKLIFGFLTVICGLSCIGIVLMIGYGIYAGANWGFLNQIETPAQISEISFKEQHKEWVIHGKTHSLDTIPDTWFLNVKTPYGYDWLRIRHAPWKWQQAGSAVTAIVTVSRISGDLNVISIRSNSD